MSNYEKIDLSVPQLRATELREAGMALEVASLSMAAAAGGNLILQQDQAPNFKPEI